MDESAAIELMRAADCTAARFCKLHPELDREEVCGEARLSAVRTLAVRPHDPSKSNLRTWVSRIVWWHLCSSARQKSWVRRHMRAGRAGGRACVGAASPRPLDLVTLFDSLNAECASVVRMTLQEGLGGRELVRLLRQELLWPQEEVTRVFREIEEALRS